MARSEASTAELATAYGIMAGKSVAQAMRDAGYAESTANKKSSIVEARLRDLGLLPTTEAVRDTVTMFRETIMGDDGKDLKQAWLSTLARARAGDIAAMRFIMEYMAGRPSQPVAVTGADGGPVETVTKIIVRWPGDPDPDDPDDSA